MLPNFDSRDAPPTLVMESAPGPRCTLSGREYLYFAGTGYLGLQAHPAVIAAAQQALADYGVHTATTRSGFGNCPPVVAVERRIAEFLASDEACYLVSGYAVNFALAAALSERVDRVYVDQSAHDCVREATLWLTNLKQPPTMFRHRDPQHLAELLHEQASTRHRVLVMTDGVFAASGRLAPLADYLEILDRYPGAMLLVDDAHGTAVLGSAGRGSLELAGIQPQRINAHEQPAERTAIFQSTTLSKAVGGHGGALVGTTQFLESVRTASGWYRGSSAPAAPVAAATAKALEIVQHEPQLRRTLAVNIAHARSALRGLGLEIEDSPAAIVSFRLRDAESMSRVQQRLLDAGIAIGYTRNYAGAGPDGMLRVAIFATHTPAMIDQLADALGRGL